MELIMIMHECTENSSISSISNNSVNLSNGHESYISETDESNCSKNEQLTDHTSNLSILHTKHDNIDPSQNSYSDSISESCSSLEILKSILGLLSSLLINVIIYYI